jgi:hypothetical protein
LGAGAADQHKKTAIQDERIPPHRPEEPQTTCHRRGAGGVSVPGIGLWGMLLKRIMRPLSDRRTL